VAGSEVNAYFVKHLNIWNVTAPTDDLFVNAIGLLLTGNSSFNAVSWAALALAPAGNLACGQYSECGDGAACISDDTHLHVNICKPYSREVDSVCFKGAHSTCSELIAAAIAVAIGAAIGIATTYHEIGF